MGFLRFNDFVNISTKEMDENAEYSFRFETNGTYSDVNSREDVDELLYEYLCNYKDDSLYDLTLEGLWEYINEDDTLEEDMKESIGKYIDLCEESIEDTFTEICD